MSNPTWNPKYNAQHNKTRKERYKNDPEYREEQKRLAAEARAKNRDETGRLLKELNGAMVPVYKMSEIAEYCGVSVTRVRGAFQRGRLPESSFEGKHVYVTAPQLELIKQSFEDAEVNDSDMRMRLEEDW